MSKQNARGFYENISSNEALREKVRELAAKPGAFDASGLAQIATGAGFPCSPEDIKAVGDDLATELGEEELNRIAGGATVFEESTVKMESTLKYTSTSLDYFISTAYKV